MAGWADVSHLGQDRAARQPRRPRGDRRPGRRRRGPRARARRSRGRRVVAGARPAAARSWSAKPGAVAELRERLVEAAAGASGLVSIVDATTKFAALTLLGPQAREVFARFTAIDLRPGVTPVRGLRPGSIARTPGVLVREDDERYLILFGTALGHYLWEVVADAAGHLGGAPVGVDSLEPIGGAAATAGVGVRDQGGRPCLTSSASAGCGVGARSSRTPTTSSSSAAARTGWPPPTTCRRSTASPMSRSSRRATSDRARPGATRRSCARTTRRRRARASTTAA